MDLDDLEAFIAIVEHGGFRRAAQATYVSQPTLTRRVARLEQELRTSLLRRSPNGIELTSSGKALVTSGRRLLATARETRATVSGRWSDSIVVACTATSVGSYLTDFLAQWIPRYPDTRLSMVEGSPRQTRRRLAEHECDVAIVALPLEREFDSLPMAHAQVEALIPPGHRFEESDGPLLVDELAGEPVVVNGAEYRSGQLLRSACRVAGIQLDIVFECTVGFTLASLVRAGLGVGIISTAVQRGDYQLTTRPLATTGGKLLGFDLHVAWARERVQHPMLETFAADLSEFTRRL